MTGPFDQGTSGPSGSPFGGGPQPSSGGHATPGPFGSRPGPASGSGPFSPSGSTAAAASATSSAASSGGVVSYTSGPWAPLIAALVTAVIGLIIAIVPVAGPMTATSASYAVYAGVAWVLCGIVTFVLAGVYTMKDNALRANSVYVAKDAQKRLYWLAVGIGTAGVLLTAYEIALWASKL